MKTLIIILCVVFSSQAYANSFNKAKWSSVNVYSHFKNCMVDNKSVPNHLAGIYCSCVVDGKRARKKLNKKLCLNYSKAVNSKSDEIESNAYELDKHPSHRIAGAYFSAHGLTLKRFPNKNGIQQVFISSCITDGFREFFPFNYVREYYKKHSSLPQIGQEFERFVLSKCGPLMK